MVLAPIFALFGFALLAHAGALVAESAWPYFAVGGAVALCGAAWFIGSRDLLDAWRIGIRNVMSGPPKEGG